MPDEISNRAQLKGATYLPKMYTCTHPQSVYKGAVLQTFPASAVSSATSATADKGPHSFSDEQHSSDSAPEQGEPIA